VRFMRLQLKPDTASRFASWPHHALVVLDEAHYLSGGTLPGKGSAAPNKEVLKAWRDLICAHKGKRLLLTATPAANVDEPESLLATLRLFGPAAECGKPLPDMSTWFEDVDESLGGGKRWTAEGRDAFVRLIRGLVSYVSLRFDQRIYPAVFTECADDYTQRACVYRHRPGSGDGATLVQPATERPMLTNAEQTALRLRNYQRMMPVVIEVPMQDTAVKGTTFRPNLRDCMTSNPTVRAGSAHMRRSCGRAAVGYDEAGVKHKYKSISGGGFDYASKAVALRAQIDANRGGLHLVIGSLSTVQANYYEPEIFAALNSDNPAFKEPRLHLFNATAALAATDASKPLRERIDSLFDQLDAEDAQRGGVRRRYVTMSDDEYALNVATHPRNATGRYVEVILIDGKSLAGTDVKGARVAHLLSPPQSPTSQKQAWGRILRRCALAPFAAQTGNTDPNVRIFTYVSVPPRKGKVELGTGKAKKPVTASPDQLLMEWMRDARTARNEVELMYDALETNAVDSAFFGEYSTGGQLATAQAAEGTSSLDVLDYLVYTLARLWMQYAFDHRNVVSDDKQRRLDVALETFERIYETAQTADAPVTTTTTTAASATAPTAAQPKGCAVPDAPEVNVNDMIDYAKFAYDVRRIRADAHVAYNLAEAENESLAEVDADKRAYVAGGVLNQHLKRLLQTDAAFADPIPAFVAIHALLRENPAAVRALIIHLGEKAKHTRDCDSLATYARLTFDASTAAMNATAAARRLMKETGELYERATARTAALRDRVRKTIDTVGEREARVVQSIGAPAAAPTET